MMHALDLFERRGYEQTSVADIAAAAGVTEMTFFRHFPTKDRVLLDDPYDAALVEAVASRPLAEQPLSRTVNGLREALSAIPEPGIALVRRRTRVVAATPSLRSAAWRNNQRTEDAVSEQLIADGGDPLEARAAVAAVLAALTTALLWWAGEEDIDLSTALNRALSVFDREPDREQSHAG
jgi:AcrR family transcriptional regulator